jgi:endoglucanase
MKDNFKNIIGYFLIFLSIVIVLYVVFIFPKSTVKNQTYSIYSFLSSSWEKYKDQYIDKDGRVIDYSQKSITTSEGQSYAMLRSVWTGDRETFDKVWTWTKNNLNRPSDKLFGWRWGKISEGKYGFSNENDRNTASDADSDIALALILGSRRWNEKSYLDNAKLILADMWDIQVATAGGKKYLIAGNWAKDNEKIVINPSYLAPYAYRIFATVDKSHDWNSLVSSSYDLLQKSSDSPIDKSKSVGLPPDWVTLNINSGEIIPNNNSDLATNYSYEALRIPWRIHLDYEWNNSKEAYDYLKNYFNFLIDEYKNKNRLSGTYTHDGQVLQPQESPIMYSTALSFFSIVDPKLAKKIYQEKILTLYSNDTNSFDSNLSYYEQNWLWFGAAIYNKQLKHF